VFSDRFLAWVRADPRLAAPLLTALGAFLVGLCNALIWPGMRNLIGYIWDRLLAAVGRRTLENDYLDSVIRQNRLLPLLPTTLVPVTANGACQELDDLYISLSVAGTGKNEIASLDAALSNHPRIVILGDPGSGKTTTLRFLSLAFARARRKRPGSRQTEARAAERTLIKAARVRVAQEFGLSDYPFPVFVYLNRLRDIISRDHPSRPLQDYILDECQGSGVLRGGAPGLLDRKLRAGQCVFLFDAFDELGTAEARDRVAELVGEFAGSAPPGNRFIVTSRIVGYKNQLAAHGFHVLTIEPLSPVLVRELTRKWYNALGEPALADQLLDALKSRPRIYELAVNPMLLSIIVLVQYVRHMIPERRHVLYKECVEILVERRFAPVRVQDAYNAVLPADDAIMMLQKIAIALHSRGLREIRRGDLTGGVISDLISHFGHFSHVASLTAQEVLQNIEERSQLLTERGIDEHGYPVIAFSHLTFQEFLASRGFFERAFSQGHEAITTELLELYALDPDWWEEVILLYAAQLSSEQQEAFFSRFGGFLQG